MSLTHVEPLLNFLKPQFKPVINDVFGSLDRNKLWTLTYHQLLSMMNLLTNNGFT